MLVFRGISDFERHDGTTVHDGFSHFRGKVPHTMAGTKYEVL